MNAKEAAKDALYKYTSGGTIHEEEHFLQGFLAGAAFERARILRLLRSGNWADEDIDAATWLESKLKDDK